MRIILLFFLLLPFSSLLAQNDTVSKYTDEVVISASRTPVLYSETSRIIEVIPHEEIKNAPVQTLQDLLELIENVDIRQRGSLGVQADVNIRGGNYEQTLILINGVKVNDPQTGHHNLNLPIDLENIDRIEVLEGPGSRIFGPNAFSGAINIITGSDKKRDAKLSLIGGEHQYYKTSLSGSYNIGSFQNYLSLTKNASNGFINNTDFNNLNVFYQTGLKSGIGKFDAQIGYLDKAFGANSFYTPAFPNQFEQTKTTFTSLQFTTGDVFKLMSDLYWRRNQDKFELFRNNPPDWYTNHNYHMTDVYGGNINFSYTSDFGITSIGGEYRSESIKSNVLGDPMASNEAVPGEPGAVFTKSKSRNNINLFLEQTLFWKRISASAGLLTYWNSDYGWKVYPGIDLSYKIFENFSAYGTFNKTLRIPTFTDLYYHDPVSIGNPNLKPEESISYEAGFKYTNTFLKSHVSFFERDGKNLLEWIKMPGDSLFRSMNLTEVNTRGIELAAQINFKELIGNKFPVEVFSVSYSYLTSSKEKADFISEYALDCLKNKFAISIQHEIIWGLGASWKFIYQDRAGTYLEYPSNREVAFKPSWITDGRLFYRWKHLNAYIEVSNIFNSDYQDISNVKQPGRWLLGGISYELGLE